MRLDQPGYQCPLMFAGVQNDYCLNVVLDFPEHRPFVGRHEQACSCMMIGAALASCKLQAHCSVLGQGVLNTAAGHSNAFATAARIFTLVG